MSLVPAVVNCVECGRQIQRRNPDTRYCHRKCKLKAERRKFRKRQYKWLKKKLNRDPDYREKLRERFRRRYASRKAQYEFWLNWSPESNYPLATLLTKLGFEIQSKEERKLSSEEIRLKIEEGKRSLLLFFHPFKRNWFTRKDPRRESDPKEKTLPIVCSNIKKGADRAFAVIENRKKQDIFGRKK